MLIAEACPIRSTPPFACPEGAYALVVTQDCDLIHHDLQAEPWCEAVLLRPIAAPEGSMKDYRNPRLLHLPARVKGEEKYFSIQAHERLFLLRAALCGAAPSADVEVSEGKLDLLLEWLGLRYTRPALPDAFVERLRRNQKPLKRLFEARHDLVREIYLNLEPFEELPAGRAYHVKILLVVRQEEFDGKREAIYAFARDLEGVMRACPEVAVTDSLVQPDNRTSVRQLDAYVAWLDFDYLTHRLVE